MRRIAALLLLTLAFALASTLGWWGVPAVAALWGLLRPRVARPILSAVVAAMLGWSAWLALGFARDWDAMVRMGTRVGGVLRLPLPLPSLLLLTLVFAGLLAWSAAALGCGLVGRVAEGTAGRQRRLQQE